MLVMSVITSQTSKSLPKMIEIFRVYSPTGVYVLPQATTPAVCIASGFYVQIVGGGTCTLTYQSAANTSFLASDLYKVSFEVTRDPQTITFAPVTTVDIATKSLTLNATASGGGAVTFTSTSTENCTISGSTLNLLKAGNCVITVSQAGTSTFSPVTASATITLTGSSGGGGGSGLFNTGITSSVGYAITTTMSPAYTAPAAAGNEYIVHSIHVTNIDGTNKVIQFTSTLASEGKSTFVSNLAYLLGQKEKKVILLDVMTYSCINCQRTYPYLADWYEKYEDDGFIIIGIHTPEFAFEKKIELSNGYFSKQLKHLGSVGSDILIRIHHAYSDLDILWS